MLKLQISAPFSSAYLMARTRAKVEPVPSLPFSVFRFISFSVPVLLPIPAMPVPFAHTAPMMPAQWVP